MTAEFFDALYSGADGDESAVPWQQAMSRGLIGEWLQDLDPGRHRRALVVAAGLGDDAAALARLGLDVVAFDLSPTAVEWAGQRHPDVAVDWHVADLFHPPADWKAAFDLVVEVFTVQSIPPELQADAAAATRAFLAPGGTLIGIAVVHDGTVEPDGPPWPFDPATLDVLADGLVEASRLTEELSPTVSCVRIEWVRPEA
jgi:SAM-dependent methyltransferase